MVEDCEECDGLGCDLCCGAEEILPEESLSEDAVTDYYETETSWNNIFKEM